MMRPVNSSTMMTSPSLYHVVDVALVERLRLERLHEVIHEDDVLRVVEVVDAERALDLLDRGLRRRHRRELLVVQEVRAQSSVSSRPFVVLRVAGAP